MPSDAPPMCACQQTVLRRREHSHAAPDPVPNRLEIERSVIFSTYPESR